MKRDFVIYVVLTIVGWVLRGLSDLNASYEWHLDGDKLWGVGLDTILLSWAMIINKTTHFNWGKRFTRLELFTAISNFCDEAFFDPYIVSWQEWATAFGVCIILFIVQKYELVRRNRF